MVYEVKMPILGFEDIKKVELKKIDDFFSSLKNVEKELPSFTLVDPYSMREYSFDLPSSAKALLEIGSDSKVLVYNIIVLQNPIDRSVVNFLAPLVFNTDNNTMGQIVLEGFKYPDFGVAEEISRYLTK